MPREAKILMNILLAIYVVICVLFTLLMCGFNDSGEPFEKYILGFVVLLIAGLSIYAIIHLIYDTYKQFASWKIISIVLLTILFYLIYSLNERLLDYYIYIYFRE